MRTAESRVSGLIEKRAGDTGRFRKTRLNFLLPRWRRRQAGRNLWASPVAKGARDVLGAVHPPSERRGSQDRLGQGVMGSLESGDGDSPVFQVIGEEFPQEAVSSSKPCGALPAGTCRDMLHRGSTPLPGRCGVARQHRLAGWIVLTGGLRTTGASHAVGGPAGVVNLPEAGSQGHPDRMPRWRRQHALDDLQGFGSGDVIFPRSTNSPRRTSVTRPKGPILPNDARLSRQRKACCVMPTVIAYGAFSRFNTRTIMPALDPLVFFDRSCSFWQPVCRTGRRSNCCAVVSDFRCSLTLVRRPSHGVSRLPENRPTPKYSRPALKRMPWKAPEKNEGPRLPVL